MSRVAMCWVHPEPLVMTFIVPRKEFVCLKCGRLYEFLEPQPAQETPKLLALVKQRQAELRTLTRGFIAPRSWHRRCAKCTLGSGEYHRNHATARQLAADRAARARIVARLPALADWL